MSGVHWDDGAEGHQHRQQRAALTPRIASGSQCSDQRPMVIGETIGSRLQETSEDNIAPVVGWPHSDEGMAAAK